MTHDATIAATLDRLGVELGEAERRLRSRRTRRLVLTCAAPVLIACALTVAAVAATRTQSSHAAGPTSAPLDVRMLIAAFDRPPILTPTTPAELKTIASLSDEDRAVAGQQPPPGSVVDKTRARLLVRNEGTDRDLLVAAPSNDGTRVCFALGADPTGPLMPSCWTPTRNGQHFIAHTPWTNLSGAPQTSIFGLAEDDVRSIRVELDGSWIAVPLENNAFLLAVPGPAATTGGQHPTGRFGTIEATLQSGEIQTADLQTGM